MSKSRGEEQLFKQLFFGLFFLMTGVLFHLLQNDEFDMIIS
jgi:hypothetical protein